MTIHSEQRNGMRIGEFYRQRRTVFSIEVFPPKTERGRANLQAWLERVDRLQPDFVSVTYGAGGGTQEGTHSLCVYIKQHLAIECMSHLTCVSHSRQEIGRVLDDLEAAGVQNLMALRGDPPAGEGHFKPEEAGYAHAIDLVCAIAGEGRFDIAVAGYPEGHVEAADYPTDLAHQINKAKAGSQVMVSQFFLDNGHFLRWRDDLRRAGVTIPIVAGILPAQSLAQVERFAGFCGVELPKQLRARLASCADDAQASAEVGLEHALTQVTELLAADVDGIHLYALNKLAPVEAITSLLRTDRD